MRLKLVLWKELHDRLEASGASFEWAEILRDLQALQTVEEDHCGKRFYLRSEAEGSCGSVFRAVGVALPPTIQTGR